MLTKRSFRAQLLAVVLVGTTMFSGCAKIAADWTIIISVAEAVANLATVADPALSTLSQEIVTGLQTIKSDYDSYQKDKTSAGAKAALIAAIQAFQQNLPQNLAAAHISNPATVARVTAAVNLILDFVDSIAGQIPAIVPSTIAERTARNASATIPKVPSKAEIRKQWNTNVCQGDQACVALLK